MRALVEGDLRATIEKNSKKGTKFFLHSLEMKSRDGRPYIIEIFSMKNERKPGPAKFDVDIRLDTFNNKTKMQVAEITKG
jgi:hypothetical protein